eukprot:CAMPEP_0184862378 /NCGR_PEP_ID=MMETSP0580-20130426/6852_1 /TAXON_ID=1118495 /ORGANISM="Dactyliosolen fragilissimus" /LENGTH=129 /DNA_ID=CAMNT_0027360223 /DNA_START=57 /DNA_END=443 /DNA_ORIENTATION=+
MKRKPYKKTPLEDDEEVDWLTSDEEQPVPKKITNKLKEESKRLHTDLKTDITPSEGNVCMETQSLSDPANTENTCQRYDEIEFEINKESITGVIRFMRVSNLAAALALMLEALISMGGFPPISRWVLAW